MKRLERLLAIALLLSARRRLKAQDLAQRFRVSLRTVYRDVSTLQEGGFPVVGTAGDGYVLPPGSQLRPLALEPAEAEALVMGARLLDRVADAELHARLQSASAKLEAALSPRAVRGVRDHEEAVLMPALGKARPGPLSLMMDAVKRREAVTILYRGAARGLPTRRTIEPLAIARVGNTWLVPAYCRLREDLRVFRVDLISEADTTGERFEPRPGFSLEDFIRLKENEPVPQSS